MLQLIHPPKCGGTALDWAQRRGGAEFFHRNGHAFTVDLLQPGDQGVGLMRDPVARFRSAWDFQWRDGAPNTVVIEQWPTIDDLALALHESLTLRTLQGQLGYLFRPLTHWYHDAETARAKCAWLGFTETLDADWLRLCDLLGIAAEDYPLPAPGTKRRNERVRYSEMSPEAEAAVRDFYADDYKMLEALRGC